MLSALNASFSLRLLIRHLLGHATVATSSSTSAFSRLGRRPNTLSLFYVYGVQRLDAALSLPLRVPHPACPDAGRERFLRRVGSLCPRLAHRHFSFGFVSRS